MAITPIIQQSIPKVQYKLFITIFITVFIAELGDKTQLATMLFASDKEVNKWLIFAGASLALITTSAIGVIFGAAISNYIGEKFLRYIAGAGFILIGVWSFVK